MLKEHEIIKEEAATFITSAEVVHPEIGNSRLGIGIIMVMAGFLGVWGCACLVSGISQVHSLREFGSTVFTAFTGL